MPSRAIKQYKVETANVVASATDGGSGSTSITTTGSARLSVTVTPYVSAKFVVTGSSPQTASAPQTLTATPFPYTTLFRSGYTGSHNITFSGANASSNPATTPTVTNSSATAI